MRSKRKCLLQAHRGMSVEFPENTMSAFKGALRQGYDIIELDPRFTADNRCVILHDRTVNRTGRLRDGTKLPKKTYVSSLTYEQLSGLEFGSWFSPEFSDEKIPSLEDVLIFAVENKIRLKFDNIIQTFTEMQIQLFFQTVERIKAQEIVEFTCSDIDFLLKVIERFPYCNIHYDGLADESVLKFLNNTADNNLTVWIRYDNTTTAWNENPPADVNYCNMVKEYGKLGIWILSTKEELLIAVNQFNADIVETNGKIKPHLLSEL